MNIIIVTINNKTSSCIMKNNLFKTKNNIKVFLHSNLKIFLNSIYVFIKHLPDSNILKKIKENKNYLVYEPLDIFWSEKNINEYLSNLKINFTYFDCILCNNNHILNIYKKNIEKKKYFLNYHEYDNLNLKLNYKYNNLIKPDIFYIGELCKSSLTNEFIKKKDIKKINYLNNSVINKINVNGIHIDFLLQDKIYYHIHTSTKLATALKCDSIFICNKIPVYVELLGNDYEYYLKDDLNNFNDIIKKATEVYTNKDKYNNYINIMKDVKLKLSPENCYKNYIDIINNINDNRSNK